MERFFRGPYEMNWPLLRAMIVLPGTGLVLIPAAVVWFSRYTRFAADVAGTSQVVFWIGLAAAGVGLYMMLWTVTLFVKVGRGTPAPWAPPKKLVIRGPYQHVRNPMISGVLSVLLAEALLMQSLPLAGWMMVFFVGNAIYMPLVEEKGLEERFGREYVIYRENVPRWFPRLRPWKQTKGDYPESS
jgi:protein-S-isoprenylcysteine O-methyltransferase Ste14